MGSDSQDLLIYENRNRITTSSGAKNKLLLTTLDNFKGLIGYVGTENIARSTTRDWLARFNAQNNDLTLPHFCKRLAQELSTAWKKDRRKSGLWVFIAGYEDSEARFWFVNNISDLDRQTGLYRRTHSNFAAVNDLDKNYIKPLLKKGITKDQALKAGPFSFRNGALFPFAPIYDKYNDILHTLFGGNDEGFKRPRTLKDFAFIARQRLEFVKRLYSAKHGIYKREYAAIGGRIYVYTIDPTGRAAECHKESYRTF